MPYSAPRLAQKNSSTIRGMARKNQTKVQAVLDRTGFGDSRMTATMIPSSTPSTMASTVITSVVRAPRSTAGVNMLSNMNPHWNTGFVSSMCTNMASSTAMTTAATHRPGCRTGTARIRSGEPVRGVVSVVMSADGRVHRSGGDGAGLHAPLVQHLRVAAVGDEGVDGVRDRLAELGLVLGHHVAVRR